MAFEVNIKEVVEFNPVRTIKRGMVSPFIDMASIQENYRDVSCVSEREFTGSGSKFKNGDTLFARITPCLENGKTAKVSSLPEAVVAHGSTEFIVMAPVDAEHDEDYVYYLARHPEFRTFAEARMEGTSGRQRVAWQALAEFQFAFPPKECRKKIGDFLRALDDKIDLNRRINQTLEAMAQAIFKSWFVDFDPVKAKIAAIEQSQDPLRAAMRSISGKTDDELDQLPSEHYDHLTTTAALFPAELEESELGEIPRGWQVTLLAELTTKIGSGSTPRGGKEVYLSDGVALIRSQNVYDSEFVWNGLARISDDSAQQLRSVEVKPADVLLNITGASILRTCVVTPDVLPARVNQHVAIIRTKDNIPSRFIHLYLLQRRTKDFLLGLNTGGSREAVTKAHIESTPIILATDAVLAAFQRMTDAIYLGKESLARQERSLAELRDTLLPKLLSGELPIFDGHDEANV